MTRKVIGLMACMFVIIASLMPLSTVAQNAIVTENALTGNPEAEWQITGAGDLTVQGFATDMSVNKGSTISFKIDAPVGVSVSVKIYRLGYYNGDGARLITTLPDFTAISQPACVTDPATGLVDCGNWTANTSWAVPSGAVSGIYIAKVTRLDTQGSSHIYFVVRDDAGSHDLMFKTSDATWQAYNIYGGNSLYIGTTSYPAGHAVKVSYNRPLLTRNGGGGGGAGQDGIFNAEYPMLRWLERNGYDVAYESDVDVSRDATPVTPSKYKVMMSVGHDEYWSAEARSKYETARANGVHLAFFSGNEIYWKTRWENSQDGDDTPYRTLVCYKEGSLGENVCNTKCDPLATVWTGLWRDGGAYPAADGNRPENELSGQISWASSTTSITVPGTYKDFWFWKNTSIASLASNGVATLTNGTLGYEWDPHSTTYQSTYPSGRIGLSNTSSVGQTHKMSLYRADNASRSWVFGAGTVQWSWGLDAVHDNGGGAPQADVKQATVNLLGAMGVTAGNLQESLVQNGASSDVTPPTVAITFPANGATLTTGVITTITGTASDVGGGVAGVDISVDGGTTWFSATGTTSWTYSWTPVSNATYTIKARAFDDNGNYTALADYASISVTTTGPVSIFTGSTPSTTKNNDNSGGISLGMKFRSQQSGYITGIRFFKPTGSNASHLGALYTWDGHLLAQTTFTSETANGWQTAYFGTPVAITAFTVYVAVYYSDNGDYAFQAGGLSSSNFNFPLESMANGAFGANGVYDYSYQPKFPTTGAPGSNYWVDVVFSNTVPPDVTAPTVSSVSPTSGSTNIAISASAAAVFSEELDPATVSSSTAILTQGVTTIPATVSYNSGSATISIVPNAFLDYSTTYTVTVKGGGSGLKDVAGNALASDYSWTFTTVAAPGPAPTTGPGGPVLVIGQSSNPFSLYVTEILKAEGWNAYKSMDIANVTSGVLSQYDIVVLGEVTLSGADATNLTTFVNNGGTLIAMRPDAQLSSLLGITTAGGTLSDAYIKVNNTTGTPGAGIVSATIQYHGTADLYTLTGGSGSTAIATLYSNSSSPTAYPAVTSRNVGSNGGQAIAFLYDLAKSVVYTRQGNPAWAGQKRDNQGGPPRSDDMFFGGSSNDWVDLSKVAIPQADEQQRLLNNLMMLGSYDKKPIPRFWFLPKGLKAAVVMTGDDHGAGWAGYRMNHLANDFGAPNGASDVTNWTALRSTGYMFPTSTQMDNNDFSTLLAQGFEFGLHLNTGCSFWTTTSWNNSWNTQVAQLKTNYAALGDPVTNRTHCVPWSDWATQPKLEYSHGVRLDLNYYYWPGTWVNDRPGMFTGSGNPMPFADIDGTTIDVYQVATQMTDESAQSFPQTINALLDKATGAEGYYGVFAANMHTDQPSQTQFDAIVTSAVSHDVPVISAKQMLNWLDGRNSSSFGTMTWSHSQLAFTLTQDANAVNLKAMLPTQISSGALLSVTRNGSPLTLTTETIKGIEYAFFDAQSGDFIATYSSLTPVTLTKLKGTPENSTDIKLEWTTSSESNNKGFEVQRSTDRTSWVDAGFVPGAVNSSIEQKYTFTDRNLSPAKYYYRLKQVDLDGKFNYSNIISVSLQPNDNFLLLQNYPNPVAGGVTRINYHVPVTSPVQISVIDMYGRTVKVIENTTRTPGSYQVQLDCSTLTKGVYYYKMSAKDFEATRKMVVN